MKESLQKYGTMTLKVIFWWPYETPNKMEKCCIMGLLPWPGHALDVEACRDAVALLVIEITYSSMLNDYVKIAFHLTLLKKIPDPL